jgi:NADP-dependent aldehyde dehydrogenase
MELRGHNLIGGRWSARGVETFTAMNPVSREVLPPAFREAKTDEIHEALTAADKSFEAIQRQSPEQRAAFLEGIADQINRLGEVLINRAQAETGLPQARLVSERARTTGQLKMFAELVRDGSWVEARLDRGQPERKPMPKPDVRSFLIPIGPVAVFAASNFPLAFSVAGGDTASALAAGNPVVVKAHPAHPGTSELVAGAVRAAAEAAQMPPAIFSMVQGSSHEVGMALVRHPLTRAVGFTGSLKAGRALFDAAAARPDPIPVYAEMGSVNPVVVLPGALQRRGGTIALELMQSVTLGAGQFCTNPGLVFGLADSHWQTFIARVAEAASRSDPAAMLYPALCDRFLEGARRLQDVPGVVVAGQSSAEPKIGQAPAMLFHTDAATFRRHAALHEELFGPATLAVACGSMAELEAVLRELPGQLTATIHGDEADLAQQATLLAILRQKAGRLIFNGYPTGVEVCAAMQHGGPWPATTWPQFTSVGTAGIRRFARPICYQNFPDPALPAELQNRNTRGIWRLVDGQLSKGDLC